MRNLLALLGAAIVTFLVVGYFLDWYHIKSTPDSEGHRQVNIDVNAPKITTDLKKGGAAVEQIIDKNKGGNETQQSPTPNPPNGFSQGQFHEHGRHSQQFSTPNAAPPPSAPEATIVRPSPPDLIPQQP